MIRSLTRRRRRRQRREGWKLEGRKNKESKEGKERGDKGGQGRGSDRKRETENKISACTPTVIQTHSISNFYTNNIHIKLYVHGSFDRIQQPTQILDT